jgi:hypothetical protein
MQIIVTPEELRAHERALMLWFERRTDHASQAFQLAQAGVSDPASRDGRAAGRKADAEFVAANPAPKLIPPV